MKQSIEIEKENPIVYMKLNKLVEFVFAAEFVIIFF